MSTTRKSTGSAYDRFMSLTPQQREAEMAEFERENLDPGKTLTAADAALHRRAAARAAKPELAKAAKKRNKMGRPKVGAGAKIVPVTIERGLLKEADHFARQHQIKRSQLVARGLRLVMEQAKKAG